MKYNQLHRSKRFAASGFTLIEISLVIALLLALIAVVFLGLGSYKQGADQARCRMQLASVQKAVRSYANLNNLNIGDPLPAASVFGAGMIMAVTPVCPSAPATYTWLGTIPPIGTPYGDCSVTTPLHTLAGLPNIADW
jgi:prepilin-type N-terminal cleavage/methylation domain-containing protein